VIAALSATPRRRVAGAVGVGLIACVAIGAVIVDRTSSSKSFFCAGVGIIDAPSASTPDAALAAYLATSGGDAADWKRGDHRHTVPPSAVGVAPYESYDFIPTHAVSAPNYDLITVQGGGRSWSASGACLADPRVGE
jgi:hypothetical protein